MPDELETCLAALFLNKGKDVLTAKEFVMYVSLDLRWMQVKDADLLMRALLEKGLMSRTGDYVKPLIDLSAANVPVAYRPSETLIQGLKAPAPKSAAKESEPQALLPRLIKEALGLGMEKGTFVAECNKVSKKMDIDIEVAALMILREKGADISPFVDDVRSSVLHR